MSVSSSSMRPITMSRLIVVTSAVDCLSLKADVISSRIFCETQRGAGDTARVKMDVRDAGWAGQLGHGRVFFFARRRTPSVWLTPYARLIHGTLRRRSRWSERTRGPVSVREDEKASDFCALLRSAIAPVDAPVASRVPMSKLKRCVRGALACRKKDLCAP